MDGLSMVATVLFMTIVAPLWIIFHFISKWKQTRVMSSDDEQMVEELWSLAQQLDDRIKTLERILETEAPDWRKDYDETRLGH